MKAMQMKNIFILVADASPIDSFAVIKWMCLFAPFIFIKDNWSPFE